MSYPPRNRQRGYTFRTTIANDEILQCVKQLEDKEHLFAIYLYDEDRHEGSMEKNMLGNINQTLSEQKKKRHDGSMEKNMLGNINQTLSEIFNCPLQYLEEKSLAIVAVHAFYRSDQLFDEWNKCKFPMFTGLLVCYILRTMRRVFEGLNEFGFSQDYRNSYAEFEDRVLEILDVSYRTDEDKTIATLKVMYNDLIKQNDSYTSACCVHYLIDLAMMAKCEKVLNHAACRRITNERWTPKINISREHFIFAFCTILPVFFITFHHALKKKRRGSIFSRSLKAFRQQFKNMRIFYSSPCSKFCVHTIFYILYIALYATVLLRRSHIDFRYVEVLRRFWIEILLYVWQLSYIFDMIYNCLIIGFWRFLASNPADTTHNIFNAIWILLFTFSTLLREYKTLPWLWGTLVVVYKLFFVLSFIFSSIRIMRVFAADSFFGSIVSTLWSFLGVILLFWGTYAVAVVSMLEINPSNSTLVWSLFSNGAFEIFGELEGEVKQGTITDCPEVFDFTDIRDVTLDCAFRTWMVPVLLFIYVLVSSVLLVNLVTSFFTNTYEEVRDSSTLHYRYKHYQRLFEYERKFFLPAPLSIIYHLPLTIITLIKYGTESLVCECCGDCYNPCNTDQAILMEEAKIELLPINIEERRESIDMVEKEEDKDKETSSEDYPLSVLVDFIQHSMQTIRQKDKAIDSSDMMKEMMNRIDDLSKDVERILRAVEGTSNTTSNVLSSEPTYDPGHNYLSSLNRLRRASI